MSGDLEGDWWDGPSQNFRWGTAHVFVLQYFQKWCYRMRAKVRTE